MQSNKEMLLFILKTTQTGQIGIKSALSCTMRPSLRSILESQLREYDFLESEAHAIAARRGWELPEAKFASQMLSNVKTRLNLSHGNSDRKIADMIIQRNSRDILSSTKRHQDFSCQDWHIHVLSQKLLDCETANIRQMRSFL